MNISKIKQISFKGYDAVPLKRIFIEDKYSKAIADELENIGKKEGFEVQKAKDDYKWIQDIKTITEQNGAKYLLEENGFSSFKKGDTLERFGFKYKPVQNFVTGGNSFIGKYPDGEKWMLIGRDEKEKTNERLIEDFYGIKRKNIFFLPQQSFHLDMYLRPVGFPYILVNDPVLAKENIDKISDEFKRDIKKDMISYRIGLSNYDSGYYTCEEAVNALKNAGFKPIRIAGVYSNDINFMNAVVNSHSDKTITYITNSIKEGKGVYERIQRQFEDDIKSKVKNIDKVYFVCGYPMKIENVDLNYMMYNLGQSMGGLHCMTLEEPSFDRWI